MYKFIILGVTILSTSAYGADYFKDQQTQYGNRDNQSNPTYSQAQQTNQSSQYPTQYPYSREPQSQSQLNNSTLNQQYRENYNYNTNPSLQNRSSYQTPNTSYPGSSTYPSSSTPGSSTSPGTSSTSSGSNLSTYNETSYSDYDSTGTYKDNTRITQTSNKSNFANGDKFATEQDRQIGKSIRDAIKGGWFSRGYDDISVNVNNGDVTLLGSVEKPDDIRKLESKVRKIDGVRNLRLQVGVRNPDTNTRGTYK